MRARIVGVGGLGYAKVGILGRRIRLLWEGFGMGITDRPEAMSLAHQGLAGATWRALDSARRKQLLSCAVAATEALHWACALDEQLKDPQYVARRD